MDACNELCANENSAAVAALDNVLAYANIRKHEGVVNGLFYKANGLGLGNHVHEPRAYYHPDLQDYIAKGEGGFYHANLRKLRDDE